MATGAIRDKVDVAMPSASPFALRTAAPEHPGYSARSSLTNPSTRPPRQLFHAGPVTLTSPQRGASSDVAVPADGDRDVAGARFPTRLDHRHIAGIEFERCQVTAGVAAGEFGGDDPAVGKTYLYILIAAQGVLGGDDDAGFPMYAARWNAPTSVNSDDGLPGPLYDGAELIRKLNQTTGHFSKTPLHPSCAAAFMDAPGEWADSTR